MISRAARYRIATGSGTLACGLAQIEAVRDSLVVTFDALSTDWDRTRLHHTMAYATESSHNFLRRFDRSDQSLRIPTCIEHFRSDQQTPSLAGVVRQASRATRGW